jgi:hypothetical protein
MVKETDTTKLEARIVELENALKALAAVRQPMDLSVEEIKAYLKVRDALSCDIFRCSPPDQFCSRCRCVISKCSPWVCGCYACDIGDFGEGGFRRFTDLGS